MKYRHVALLFALSACSDSATPNGGATDTGADATPDSGVDVTPDNGVDVTPDNGVDVTPDGGADATPGTPPRFLSAYGNGATIDVLSLNGDDGTVTDLSEWPNLVGYVGMPVVVGDRFAIMGIFDPSDVEEGRVRLCSLDPDDFSLEQHPLLTDQRIADLFTMDDVLYGIVGTGATIELSTLDLATGTATSIGTIPDLLIYYPRAVSLDGTIQLLGETAADPGIQQLFQVDPNDVANATHVTVTPSFPDLLDALYVVDARLIGMYGTGSEIEIYEITPATGAALLIDTIPGLYSVYAPSYAAVGNSLYLLGFPSAGALPRLYRVPIDDVPSTTAIAVDRDTGDLHLFTR